MKSNPQGLSIFQILKQGTSSKSKSTQEVLKGNQKVRKSKIRVKNDFTETKPLETFKEIFHQFKVPQWLQDNVLEAGYTEPTEIQKAAIPQIFQSNPVLATAPTGSGKTLSFLLPLLSLISRKAGNGIQAILLEPTSELAQQLYREAQLLSKDSKLEIGFLTELIECGDDKKECDILISTPLKYLHFTTSHELNTKSLKFIVFDESDKYFEDSLSEQIHSFMTAVESLSPMYFFFSATIQFGVEDFINVFMPECVRVEVGGKNRVLDLVDQRLTYTGSEEGKLIEIRNLIERNEFQTPCLIFLQSKDRAKELFHVLNEGILKSRIGLMTADVFKEQRKANIEAFRVGRLWVLISTDLMARGIDFKGVKLVINYDMPTTMIGYIHRVGRTGRAGRKGNAITFFTNEDKPILKTLGNLLKASGCSVPDWILGLKKAKKEEMKNWERRPLVRDGIGQRQEADPEFVSKMNIRNKIFLKKIKKENEANYNSLVVSERQRHINSVNFE